MRLVVGGVQALGRWVCWIAFLGLSVMMFLTCADVVLRYFGHPIKGAFDIVGLMGVVVVALPIAYTQLLGGHISIEFIAMRFRPRVKKTVDAFNCLLNILLYSLLAWQFTLFGNKLGRLGRVSETLQLPLSPFAYVVAFSCALMSLVLLAEFYTMFISEEKR